MSNTEQMRAALIPLFKDAMDWGRSYGTRLNLSPMDVDIVSEGYAEKAIAAISSQPVQVEHREAAKEIWNTDSPTSPPYCVYCKHYQHVGHSHSCPTMQLAATPPQPAPQSDQPDLPPILRRQAS